MVFFLYPRNLNKSLLPRLQIEITCSKGIFFGGIWLWLRHPYRSDLKETRPICTREPTHSDPRNRSGRSLCLGPTWTANSPGLPLATTYRRRPAETSERKTLAPTAQRGSLQRRPVGSCVLFPPLPPLAGPSPGLDPCSRPHRSSLGLFFRSCTRIAPGNRYHPNRVD